MSGVQDIYKRIRYLRDSNKMLSGEEARILGRIVREATEAATPSHATMTATHYTWDCPSCKEPHDTNTYPVVFKRLLACGLCEWSGEFELVHPEPVQ